MIEVNDNNIKNLLFKNFYFYFFSIVGGERIWTLDVSFGEHQEVPTNWATRLLAKNLLNYKVAMYWRKIVMEPTIKY